MAETSLPNPDTQMREQTEFIHNVDRLFQSTCGDSSLPIPRAAGKGYFRTLLPTCHMSISVCDATFHHSTVLTDYKETAAYTLTFCLSEQMHWENETTRNSFSLSKNQCCLYGGGTFPARNCFAADSHCLSIGIHLHPQHFTAVFDHFQQADAISRFDQPETALRKFKISAAAETVIRHILYCPYTAEIRLLYLEAKILELTATLLNELLFQKRTALPSAALSREDRNRLEEVKEILDRQYSFPPTIAELARHSLMSETKLKTAFKHYFGKSLHGYVIDRRLEKARELLEVRALRVKEAASLVGYTNISYFSEKFLEKYGFPPGQYRKNH